MINTKYLPQIVRDKLELKEELENTFSRALECDYTENFFEIMDERKKKELQKNLLLSWVGEQGSSKSYSGLFVCGYMNKDFNIENIYFDYNQLVNERYKLKPGTAVLIDEQMALYGIDSNRISIILTALKEMMRKRSIHLVFCSPTLKPEYQSSMYVLETMFIDKEYSESYHALKTNQLHCLGYVVIPHPLKVISKKLLLEYEKKKDEHLEHLTTQPIDDVATRAEMIINDKVFKQAESIYKEKIGFIPYRNLVQVINMMFPEFKGSVIVYELADRVRLMKELCGDWEIAGKSWLRKKTEAEDRRDEKRMSPALAKPSSIPMPDATKKKVKSTKTFK